MIYNSICLVNLIISTFVLSRKFNVYNFSGSILAFVAAVTLTIYSSQGSDSSEDSSSLSYNVLLGNTCVFLAVVMFSVQNV